MEVEGDSRRPTAEANRGIVESSESVMSWSKELELEKGGFPSQTSQAMSVGPSFDGLGELSLRPRSTALLRTKPHADKARQAFAASSI